MKTVLILKKIPILLNRLYIPFIKNGRASIRKNPKAKEFAEYVFYQSYIQKCKLIKGTVSVKIDVLIHKRKNYDLDNCLKLLFDSLNNILYEDDKMIIKIEARKHLKSSSDEIIISVESIE